jgi:hypothetical protein
MVGDELSVLAAFLAVAEERSFTKAAKRLEVSTSALSHAIRRLEEQIGVRLLARTTRSVSPTEAGEQLLDRLRPALGDIRGALDQLFWASRPSSWTDTSTPTAAGGEDGARAKTGAIRSCVSGRRARHHNRRQARGSRRGRVRRRYSVRGVHRAGHDRRSRVAGSSARDCGIAWILQVASLA